MVTGIAVTMYEVSTEDHGPAGYRAAEHTSTSRTLTRYLTFSVVIVATMRSLRKTLVAT